MMAANVPIYTEQGGTNMFIGDGATLTVQDGGTITVEAGGTLDGAGAIEVPDGSITAAKLAADSVTTVKILDDNVTTAKIAPLNVTAAELAADAVTTAKILDDNVTTAKIAPLNVTDAELAADSVITSKILDLNVTTGKLAAGAVTKAKTAMFISGNTVGDGMPQVIPHGLGVDPTTANLFFSVIDTAMAGDFAFTNIATDNMNITVTVTANVVYRAMAWAP
jgi:hypothetical protein